MALVLLLEVAIRAPQNDFHVCQLTPFYLNNIFENPIQTKETEFILLVLFSFPQFMSDH
jgi:hypothetical protein